MKKIHLIRCVLLSATLFLTACGTEQEKTQSSSSMVTYNEDFAKNQARLTNEAVLEKNSISNTPAVLDGNSHRISNQTVPNTSK